MSKLLADHVADSVSVAAMRAMGEEKIKELVRRLDLVGEFDPYRYVPSGPVAQAFILDMTPTAVLMGPLGGGKTTACAFKRIFAATLAPIARHPVDGVPTRMCRWLVLRDTFRSAEKTVLESWKQWFPKGYPGSSWAGGNDRPVTHTLRFMGRDGVRIEAITEFAGLNENDIESMMKGREYSGVWLNELDTHAEGALDDAEQRVGRYPKKDLLLDPDAPRRGIVIGDMNAPTIDNWTYKVLVIARPEGRAFHQQPSGRSAEAENRFNLEPDYYAKIVQNQDESFVRRMVDNEFGYSRAGKAVFETFNPRIHVARQEISFNPALDLVLGVDISTNTLNPAAVFLQPWQTGRIAAIGELYLGHGVGPARFAEAIDRMLRDRFAEARNVRIYVDPAAEYGGDREGGQLAAMETIAMLTGIPTLIPANGSNELGLRLDAVKQELRGYLEPNTTLLICPKHCPMLIEAFGGKYRYKKRPAQASTEYEDTPEKTHPASDIMDGAQYGILGIRGRTAILRASAKARPAGDSPWKSGKAKSGRGGGFNVHKAGL